MNWFSAKKNSGSINPVPQKSEMGAPRISARTRYLIFSGIFLITTVASIYVIIRYWKEIAELQQYGYLGAFVIAFIAGSSIPTPISYLLLTFTFGGIPGMHPAIVGLASGVGAGSGGTLVYLLGRGGRRFFPGLDHYSVDEHASSKLTTRFVGWAQKRGSVVVFFMSAMLNPVFAPMAIAMGALRFRLAKFFLMCVAGNLVKAMVISYAGYFGLGTLLRWLSGV
jgi:membrane protein YqaA with SNARE-associated domain